MSLNIVAFEPLLRVMGLKPTLARFAPKSRFRTLKTILLRDSPLTSSLKADFDDSCFLTLPVEADIETWCSQVTLQLHAGKLRYSGVHLAFLSNRCALSVVLGDDQLKVIIGSDCIIRGGWQLFGRATVFVGDCTTMGQVRLIGARADVVIGDDCQFSDEVILQSSDQHPIFDLESGLVVNADRRSIWIDRHVWIGRRAMVLPDACIGAGSIVAAGAVVTQEIPKECLAAGVPARVVKQKVGWAREFGQKPPQICGDTIDVADND
ncbi:acyltransferase [Ideonella paludis]|uniref:Acyltransferase n=1 Tax=Ideonella paludis TaxID=1233411 RepID=A0ABS5DTJ2_9BURK|nr:acyltransferase [Ideonella paludis]MBQ0934409.1 acyltransferase [Ideonella paludis]